MENIEKLEADLWSAADNLRRRRSRRGGQEDEDFDFEQSMRDLHSELADLNEEAAALAAKIQANFEGLAV